jgi:hypothetical protein
MRALMLVAMLAGLAAPAALAQQAAPRVGGSCSGHKAACDQTCRGGRGRCEMNCEATFSTCMQTGEWRGYLNQFTNVERR